MFRFDAGLGGLDLGRVGLRKQSDKLVLVRPLPVLELGVLGQGLEVADLHGRDLVLEKLFLEGELLGVPFEHFLWQTW